MPPTRRSAIEYCLRRLAPEMPLADFVLVVENGLDAPGLKRARPEHAAWLALVAHVRHAYTDYDAMLEEGYDVDSARFFCLPAMNEMLAEWGSPRRVRADEEGEGEDEAEH